MATVAAEVKTDVGGRVDDLDWDGLETQLDDVGHAVTPVLLSHEECAELADLFDSGQFRSTIDMARHRFGDGRYRYFDHPLPELIAALRLVLPPPGPGGQPLERAAARRYTHLPARPRGAPRALP